MTDNMMLARAWQIQSMLIGYPDENLHERADLLRQAAASLPGSVGGPLLRFLDHLAAAAPAELAAEYVATFDHRKRCCLYLTYYAHGDTRNRGMALLELKQTYAVAGLKLTDEELPDHLAVVLEYAAIDPGAGLALLVAHRAGLELLRLALHDATSPWAGILDAISATLPPLIGDQRTAVARLAAQGPPAEQVGLTPYALPHPEGVPR
ncbi:nitrate reductase molybdenum cofactor assembly chaperone [Actinoplanes oblitus]|uniref:Nitrate reductase molybdenum cofactor assembly chaperone n=1 Tax=Actinoplanes oblitus TaxID=3040509 RepID=A0ABY8WR85_9ACTN|nr:nitrate reductase molybdenum cofactor assembly chaperone [Actinoplanes oblitus]WIN00164.1 nitrate reductase molybdenum cofactor assembly chaperone [Actinoplanes oblitus]